MLHDATLAELDASARDDWGDLEPLTLAAHEVHPFDTELLPAGLDIFVGDIAERLQCPADYVAAPLMVVLGSLIGQKRSIAPKAWDDWKVFPNLFGAIIGRPSLLKTPAMKEALLPLEQLEDDAHRCFQEDKSEFEKQEFLWAESRKVYQGKIRKAIGKGDRSTASNLAEELNSTIPVEPSCQRFIVHDTTVEKLGELLNENPNGLLLIRDELTGFLRQLDKPGHETDRSFYLEAWNGCNSFSYDRIGRGTVRIAVAIVSVMGTIQPGPLGAYLIEAMEGGKADDGLLQRFQLLVWPERPKVWRNVDRTPNLEARDCYSRICHKISKFERVEEPLRFTAEAQIVFDRWREELEMRLLEGNEPAPIEAHLAKYRSLIPSLALIIHVAEEQDGPVNVSALERALGWGIYLESHARRIFGSVLHAERDRAKRILQEIEKGTLEDGFSARDVYRNGWTNLGTAAQAQAGLRVLEDHNIIRPIDAALGVGRPKISYEINPSVSRGTS